MQRLLIPFLFIRIRNLHLPAPQYLQVNILQPSNTLCAKSLVDAPEILCDCNNLVLLCVCELFMEHFFIDVPFHQELGEAEILKRLQDIVDEFSV
jgi:hypothetical protein